MRIYKIVRSALLTLFFSHCLGVGHLSREAQGSITYDRALVGFVIASFETRGFLSCGHECLGYPSCKSYNYHPTTKEHGLCELNDNEGELKADLIGLEGSLFAKLTRQEFPRSCLDLTRSGAQSSGLYYIRDSEDNPIRVFCDLASESGWAWTLVMSQSFRNRKIKQLMRVPLSSDAPLNTGNPNWEAYRLSLQKMEELRAESSHWRVTCNFPTGVIDYRDYVKGNFSQVNVLNIDGHSVCKKVDYINVKGRNCSDCTVAWWQDSGTMFHHDLSLGKCFFETFTNVNAVYNADYFGWYENIDSSFSCCADGSSSTNHWFGGHI